MPTYLSDLVRAKFPGAYDHLPDDQLEDAWIAKYPGAYEHLKGVPSMPALPSFGKDLPAAQPGMVPSPKEVNLGLDPIFRALTPIADPDPSGDIKRTAKSIYEGGKSVGKAGASKLWQALQDPHTTLPTAGAVIGGIASRNPFVGAGPGAALGETAAEVWDALQGREVPNPPMEIAKQYVGGAAAEGIPRVIGSAFGRPGETVMGAQVKKLYGDIALPSQRAESSKLDFLKNIAEGMTGSGRMRAVTEAQRDITEQTMTKATTAPLAPGQSPSAVLGGRGGEAVASKAAQTFESAKAPVSKAYDDFFRIVGRNQELPQTGLPNEALKTVQELHAERSDLLERARDAVDAGDMKSARSFLQEANQDILPRMQKAMGTQASTLYDKIGSHYRDVMETYNNPIMRKLRQGVKPEQVADMLLNPTAKIPTMTDLGEITSLSVPESIARIKAALPDDAWRELQGTVIHRMTQLSTKPVKTNPNLLEIKGDLLVKLANQMGKGFPALFEGQAIPLRNTIETIAYSQKKPLTEAGKFFIDLRQAAAISGAAGAVAAAVSPEGSRLKAAGESSAGTMGFILLAPWALSRIMTNPTASKLLIKALNTQQPTARQAIFGQINAIARQFVPRAAMQETPTGPHDIPLPPDRRPQ